MYQACIFHSNVDRSRLCARFQGGNSISLKIYISCMLFYRSQCSGFANPTKVGAQATAHENMYVALANASPSLPGDEVFSGWLSPRHLICRDQVGSTCPRAQFFTHSPENNKHNYRARKDRRVNSQDSQGHHFAASFLVIKNENIRYTSSLTMSNRGPSFHINKKSYEATRQVVSKTPVMYVCCINAFGTEIEQQKNKTFGSFLLSTIYGQRWCAAVLRVVLIMLQKSYLVPGTRYICVGNLL